LAWGKDILKAIVYYGKHRRRIQEDVVTACEMEFLTSSILSPFYLWHRSLQLWRHSENRHLSLTTRSDKSSSRQAKSQV
jgi:hypothetical protein